MKNNRLCLNSITAKVNNDFGINLHYLLDFM